MPINLDITQKSGVSIVDLKQVNIGYFNEGFSTSFMSKYLFKYLKNYFWKKFETFGCLSGFWKILSSLFNNFLIR